MRLPNIKGIQDALVTQAYASYKAGYIHGKEKKPLLSFNEFCGRIKEIIELGSKGDFKGVS